MSEKYTIQIEYITGDSFHSEKETSLIGACFENLDLSRKALLAIEEHHNFVQKINDNSFKLFSGRDSGKEIHSFLLELQKKSWYYFDKSIRIPNNSERERFLLLDYHWQHSILVETSPNQQQLINTFWIGHFENLLSATVILEKPLSISFH